MLLFAACLAVWIGVSLWRGMTDPLATAVVYSYTVNDSVEVEGLFVRQEKVITSRTGIADVSPGEGERVGAGQTVAVFYRSAQALEDRRRIQQLTLEAELLKYTMGLTDTETGTAELEDGIVSNAVALRANVAVGKFDQLESQVLDLKRAVLKRDYVYGQMTDTARLSELNAQIRSLRVNAEQNISRVTAEEAGVFSAQVDGYETLLTPRSVSSLTAGEVLELLELDAVEPQDVLGKLITSNRWYFLTVLPERQAERLIAGGRIVVRFSGDFTKDVNMQVEALNGSQDGQTAVLLSSDRYLSSTTLLRRQTAELIFDSSEGLRVPKSCVHILTKDQTDPQTGQTQQIRTTGVYALVNGRAEFRRVQVLAEGSQFYVVKPLDEGRTTLRAGDQVILRAKDLSNGKVLQE